MFTTSATHLRGGWRLYTTTLACRMSSKQSTTHIFPWAILKAQAWVTIVQSWMHLFRVFQLLQDKFPFRVYQSPPPSVAQGCSPFFHAKLCRRTHTVTVKFGGDVPDTETTGKQTCLSSAVAARDTAGGRKVKNSKHGCGKPGTRDLCLNTGGSLTAIAGFVGPSLRNYSRGSKCKQQSSKSNNLGTHKCTNLQVPIMDCSA